MSDILKQIQVLQEQFSNLFNEDYDTLDNASHIKRVHGTPEYTKDESGKYKRDENGFRVPANKAAELFQKGHPKDGRTMYGDGYLGQGSGVVWTKRDNNLYDEDDNLKDSSKAVEKSIKRNENKVKKMNDNNSYNEILSQILTLKEDFMNLFEVDDLGNPAVDVPPSQNKIKRDRKTKDGKVEVVSVEDELFPYDGNKREQYRQKIIDIINNMIQGTATLEDLLQFVRQKKAPLKEAMEILEDIKGTIKKKYGKPDKEYYYYPLEPGEEYEPEEHSVGVPKKNKSAELTDKAAKAQYNEVQGAAKREGKSEKDILIKRKETKNSEGTRKTRHRSDIVADPWSNDKMNWYKYGSNDADRVKKSIARHEKKEQQKAPLKEAMELMENIHRAIEKYVSDPKKKEELHDKAFDNYVQDDAEQMGRIEDKLEGVKKNSIEAYNKAFDIKRSHDTNKRIKGEVKTDERSGITRVWPNSEREDDEFREQYKKDRRERLNNNESFEGAIEILEEEIKKERKNNKQQVYMRMDDPEKNKIGVKKNYNRVIHNDSASKDPAFDYVKIKGTKYGVDKYGQIGAPLKEAFELMETALTAIRNSGLPKEKQQELTSKLAKGRAKERELADEKAFKSWAKGDRKQLDVQTVRDPEFTKNASGERKTRLRSHSNNYTKSGGRKIKPEWKQVEDSIKRHEKKVQKNSPLKEAMEVLEELIGEGRNLEDVVVRGYNKGKVPLDDLQKLMDKAHEVPSDSSYFHKSKGEKGELRTKHRHMDYERNVLSDGWGKDDNKKIEASIKRKAKNDKSFPVFQALKAYKEGKADLKEALSLTEEIINEVSERTKIDAYKKRVAQHIERAEHDRNMANEYAKMGGYDHAIDFLKDADASQKKEFKHRLRTMTHDKKFGQDAYNKAQKELFDEWKAKKNIKEALSLMEEIINEVSVKKWKEAAKNSVEGRKEKANQASDRFGEVVYPFRPEVNDPGHRLANAWDRAEQRADRAEQLAKNLPDSNKSATKLKNVAKKVVDKRDKNNEESVKNVQDKAEKYLSDKGTREDYLKSMDTYKQTQNKENKARNLVGKPERRPEWNESKKKHELREQGYIDRTNEAIEIMEEIINELSPETVKRAFDKRTDKSLEADEKDRKEFNDILKIKDRDKRAATFKEFKKRSDDRFNKEEKKNDLYFNYALKHPEILEEALSLMEDIINEVSIGKWKEAAKNSMDKRKEAAENTAKTAEQSWDDYEEGSRKHPEEEDALYKRAWRNDIIAKKAEGRADHASDVLGIKAKGKSANKTIKAAKNSEIKRNDAYLQNTDPEKFDKLRNRMEKTDQLVMADPVKSRNEVD